MKQNFKTEKENDDIIYFDTTLYNNSDKYVPLEFNQIRGEQLLKNSSDYNLSIVRFKVPTSAIPIFNFIPQAGYTGATPPLNNDRDLGIYSITYSYNGVDRQVYLRLQPSQSFPGSELVPKNWMKIDQNNYKYYTIYSYTYFIKLINIALQEGFYYCQNTAPFNTSPTITSGASAPFITYNGDTQLFTINCSKYFSEDYMGAPTLEIYFNHVLSDFFQGFLSSSSDSINGKFARISVVDTGNNIFNRSTPQLNYYEWSNLRSYNINELSSLNNINYVSLTNGNINNKPDVSPSDWNIVPQSNKLSLWSSTLTYNIGDTVIGSDGNYYTALTSNTNINPLKDDISPNSPNWNIDDSYQIFSMKQEYSSLYLWEIFTNLIFASPLLPISKQNQGGVTITNTAHTNAISSSQLPILTDFDPLIENGPLNRSYLQYYASGPYRLINITSDNDLTNFNYRVYWVDKYSNVYPLLMDRGTVSNAKFLFQKKGKRS